MTKPTSQKLTSDPRTWVEVKKGNIKNNFNEFKKYIGEETLMAGVVKSNAYGHGILKFSQILINLGIDWIIVDAINEAVDLRNFGVEKPMLVLGYTPPKFFKKAKDANISLTISSHENIEEIISMKKPPKVHVKVNTGMNRQGFHLEEVGEVLDKLNKKGVGIEGIYTHFGEATIPDSLETKKQIENFKKAVEETEGRNIECLKHTGATAGTIAFPEGYFDMVRVGIGMYGLWPSPELKEKYSNKLNLKPVLKWKSIISEIKKLPKGSKIGYDFTKTLEKDAKLAITPVGYWHGYPTQLSNRGEVYVKGNKVPVVGKVSMNMMILDVTDIEDIKVGDEVEIVGEKITADKIAEKVRIINYEVVTRINPLIKRRYVN